jgi:hypothetical protein
VAYISKKNVRRWLENYQALEAGDQLPNPEGVVVNQGPKNADGISGGRLNKIMIDQALGNLRREAPLSYACIRARWLRPIRLREALRMLGISQGIYYTRCNAAIEALYWEINGLGANYKALEKAIIRANSAGLDTNREK